MSQSPFQKFVAPKKNSVIKEEFRQEKKKYRKERNAFFDKKKEEEYQARIAKRNGMANVAVSNISNTNKVERANAVNKPAKGGAAKTPHTKSAKAIAANDNTPTGIMPLNKYLAHCGVCSRRDAVGLINAGKIKVNGTIATEPGYKVKQTALCVLSGIDNKPAGLLMATKSSFSKTIILLNTLKGKPALFSFVAFKFICNEKLFIF